MLIISIRSDLSRWFVAVVLALELTPVHAALDAAIGTEGHLRVTSQHSHVSAELATGTKRDLRLSPLLAKEIGSAQTFFAVGKRSFVQGDVTWLLLVAESESRANHAAGACGSGTEDTLHLVQVDMARAQLVERSSLLLQSCLTGLSLNDDSGRSLQETLEAVTDPSHVQLKWLNHPDYGDKPKTLTIVNGVIKLE